MPDFTRPRLLYSAADGFFIAPKQRTVGGVIRSNGLPAKYHHKHAAGAIPGRSKSSTDMQKSLPVATARTCPGYRGIRKVWSVATAKGDTA